MEPFKKINSKIVPLDKINVDTDQIIPKQFLKQIKKSGFGKYLFYNWRYNENHDINQDFVLNDPAFNNSRILVTGDNFGCGSSREHAVWALQDYGFSIIIAPSFADIFSSNCLKNGILLITLNHDIIDEIQQETEPIQVDLETQIIKTINKHIRFEVNKHVKKILLEGLDDIDMTMKYIDEISKFEKESKIPSVL